MFKQATVVFYRNEKRKVCVFDSWHYLIGIEVLNGGTIQGTSEVHTFVLRFNPVSILGKDIKNRRYARSN